MKQILNVFIIFALAPIIFFALGVSFVMNDISLLNPFEWVTAARFTCLVWVLIISMCILEAASDGHI